MSEISRRNKAIAQVKENTIHVYKNMLLDDIEDLYDTAYKNGYADGTFASFVDFAKEIKKDYEKDKTNKKDEDLYVKGYVDAILNMNSKGYKMAHECSTCKYYGQIGLAGGRTMQSYYCSLMKTFNVVSYDFCSKWVKRKETN